MKKLYLEFIASLKDIAVEEVVDLYIFRPISFIIVKIIYRLPVTPNQISFLSILAGIASGVFYAFGDPESFIYAGLLYGLSHVLDCCDGMIARLKKNGTPIGRIIDGWADYITAVSVYTGFMIGLYRGDVQLPVLAPWLMVALASLSLALHSMKVDYYRHEFLAHALGKTGSVQEELKLFSNLLAENKKQKGKWLENLLITFFIRYTKLQLKKARKQGVYSREKYYRANKVLLMLWNWIGLSTHIFVLIIASILYEPMIYFYYVLGLANVWMLVIGYIQVATNKKIAASEPEK